MKRLTNKQQIFLNTLDEFIKTNGYTPTIREFGNHIGLNSPATIKFYLDTLEKKGYIERKNNRCIKVIKDANS